jgi:hypothetical protein
MAFFNSYVELPEGNQYIAHANPFQDIRRNGQGRSPTSSRGGGSMSGTIRATPFPIPQKS